MVGGGVRGGADTRRRGVAKDARRTKGVRPVVVSPDDVLEILGSEKRTRFFERFLEGVVG
jgi:hypothetical protein